MEAGNRKHRALSGRLPFGPAVVLLLIALWGCGGPAPPSLPQLIEEASRLAAEGTYWFNYGCYEKAEPYFEQAMERSRLLDDTEGILRARNNLGAVALAQGRLDQAAAHLNKALVLAQKLGDVSQEATIYGNLAAVAFKAGRAEDAEVLWLKALETLKGLAGSSGEALHRLNLGALYRSRGQYDKAGEWLNKSLEQATGENNLRQMAGAQRQLGLLELDRKQPEKAESRLFQALELDKEAENPRGIARDLEELGRYYQVLENWSEALIYLDRGIYLRAAIGDWDGVKKLHGLLQTNHAKGNQPESMVPYDQLLNTPEKDRPDLLCH